MTGEHPTPPLLDLTRPMIEGEIERLISILDWLDPDPDIEDDGDAEPDEDGARLLLNGTGRGCHSIQLPANLRRPQGVTGR